MLLDNVNDVTYWLSNHIIFWALNPVFVTRGHPVESRHTREHVTCVRACAHAYMRMCVIVLNRIGQHAMYN